MIVLPDGAKMDMSWKSVEYINHDDFINFQIIPMYKKRDIIIIPNKKNWERNSNVFTLEERDEIIFLLERLNWKREISVIELDIPLEVNYKTRGSNDSLESTDAYAKMTKENLFDDNSMLDNEQVKSLYLTIEKRFAENLHGEVNVSRDLLLEGSVMKEFVIPILEKNRNVKIKFI